MRIRVVNTAANTLTAESEALQIVCFSPEKRQKLQQFHQTNYLTLLRIHQIKSSNSQGVEYTASKKTKITSENVEFQCDDFFNYRLHTVKQALDANIYETMDLEIN